MVSAFGPSTIKRVSGCSATGDRLTAIEKCVNINMFLSAAIETDDEIVCQWILLRCQANTHNGVSGDNVI